MRYPISAELAERLRNELGANEYSQLWHAMPIIWGMFSWNGELTDDELTNICRHLPAWTARRTQYLEAIELILEHRVEYFEGKLRGRGVTLVEAGFLPELRALRDQIKHIREPQPGRPHIINA